MTAPQVLTEADARKRRVRWAALLLGVFALLVWLQLDDPVHEFVGPTMGSTYTVSVDADLSAEDHESVRRAVDMQLDRVNTLMSTYDPSSEISRFNQHESTDPFEVSQEVLTLLWQAREVGSLSGGAFDVTVAPLVDAWGFGASDRTGPIPDGERLAALLLTVGFEGLALDDSALTASKANPQTRVDLSAIAQGYASDFVASALTGLGLTNFLVDVGGEIRAVGTRRNGSPWRVGIETPDGTGEVWGTVELADEGIATSGDYRNFFEEGGVRYAHIIDPRTGQPIHSRNSSVTVLSPTAALADAWATALCVLGPDEGFALARREGIAALFITTVEGRFEYRVTPAMEGRVAERTARRPPG